jgi:hypothetical protein
MALIIENGTGVSGADSFKTVAQCDADAVAYFGAALPGDNAAKEAALRRAWVYMGGLEWQADLWPTFGGTIPANVALAQSVLARAEAETVGILSPSVAASGRKVLTGVKGINWTLLPGIATIDGARAVVTMAMDLLGPYLLTNPAKSGGRTYAAVRS